MNEYYKRCNSMDESLAELMPVYEVHSSYKGGILDLSTVDLESHVVPLHAWTIFLPKNASQEQILGTLDKLQPWVEKNLTLTPSNN